MNPDLLYVPKSSYNTKVSNEDPDLQYVPRSGYNSALQIPPEQPPQQSFMDQLANAGLGAVDALVSGAGQAVMFPMSLAYGAAGHLSGQGKEVADRWASIPTQYFEPGKMTNAIRGLAGLPAVAPEHSMAAKYLEPVSKVIETAIPSQQIEAGLGQAKELGIPFSNKQVKDLPGGSKIVDAVAFGTAKFIELMAFGGYHKLVVGGARKIKSKLNKYEKAKTPEARIEAEQELEDVKLDVLNKIAEKGGDITELKKYVPAETPITPEIEARNAENMARTNAESQRFMQSRGQLQGQLERGVDRTAPPEPVPIYEDLPPVRPTENVSAKLEAMRQQAKDEIAARNAPKPTPEEVLAQQREAQVRRANEVAAQGALQQRNLQTELERNVPATAAEEPAPELPPLPPTPNVSSQLEAMRAAAKAELDRINNAPTAGSEIPLRLEAEAQRTNQIAADAATRQRELQARLGKPVDEMTPAQKKIQEMKERIEARRKVAPPDVGGEAPYVEKMNIVPDPEPGPMVGTGENFKIDYGQSWAGFEVDGKNVIVHDVLVDKPQRKQGIASKMLKTIEEAHPNKDIYIGSTNRQMDIVAKKNGYELVSPRKQVLEDGVVPEQVNSKTMASYVKKSNIVPEPAAEPLVAEGPKEFPSYKAAKAKNMVINKRRFKSQEEAQAFLDSIPKDIPEGQPELIKVGDKWRVAIDDSKMSAAVEAETTRQLREIEKDFSDIDAGIDVPRPKVERLLSADELQQSVLKMVPEIEAALAGQNIEATHAKLKAIGDQALASVELELSDKIDQTLTKIWRKKLEQDARVEAEFAQAHAQDLKSAEMSVDGKAIEVDGNGYNGLSIKDLKNVTTAIKKIVDIGEVGAVGDVGSRPKLGDRIKSLSQEEIDSLRNVAAVAKKKGKDVLEFLKASGMSEVNAQRIKEMLDEMGEGKVSRKELKAEPTAEIVADTTMTADKGISSFNQFWNDMREKGELSKKYAGEEHYEPQHSGVKISDAPQTTGKKMGSTMLSPHNVFHGVFKLGDNPATDAFKSMLAFAKNVMNGKKWSKDVLRDIPEMSKRSKALLDPFNEEFARRVEMRAEVGRIDQSLKEQLKNLSGDAKKKKIEEWKQNKARFKEINELTKEMVAKWDEIMQGPDSPARHDPTVRVVLEASGHLPEGIELSYTEARAAKRIREFFDMTKERMKEQGLPVHEGKFVSRVWKPLVDEKVLDSGFIKRVTAKTPAMLRQMKQLPDGRPWYPDAKTILETYIPVIERELAYNPMLQRWKTFIDAKADPKMRKYMRTWVNENLYRKPETALNNIVSAATALEFARIIGLSIPVAFKHLTKIFGTVAQYDIGSLAEALYRTNKAGAQKLLEMAGVKGEKRELEVFRSYVTARHLVKALDEAPVSGFLDMTKAILGSPVTAIEAFDNGLSIFAAIAKGGKKGLSSRMTERAMLRTVLDVNFRGGWDQPVWLKHDLARVGLMFQVTPFKATELKYQMIKRMVNNERDAFGTHYGTMLAKYALLIGAAELIARANDTSMLEQLMHVPFTQGFIEGTQKGYDVHVPKVATSPFVQLASEMTQNRKGALEGAKKHYGLDRDFLPTTKSSPSLARYEKALSGKHTRFNNVFDMMLGLKPLKN